MIAHVRPTRLGGLLIVAGLALMAVAPLDQYKEVFGHGAMIRLLAWGVPAALIVYGSTSLEPLFKGRWFNVPVLIGDASYSIYLFHYLVVSLVKPWPVAVVAAVAFGLGAFWLLERRIMAIRKRLHLPRRAPAAT